MYISFTVMLEPVLRARVFLGEQFLEAEQTLFFRLFQ